MGVAALKLDQPGLEDEAAGLVHLMPANTDLPPTPAEPKADLQRILGIISKIAVLLSRQRDRANAFEKRCLSAEDLAKEAGRRVLDLEQRLKVAVDEAGTERRRAAEMQKRSVEVVERSRAMLAEASDRLRNAEARASRAEAQFATVREALERQFGREASTA